MLGADILGSYLLLKKGARHKGFEAQIIMKIKWAEADGTNL